MEKSYEQERILLIFSKRMLSEELKNALRILEIEFIKFDYVFDPTRYELETLIQKKEYLCVIPFTQYIQIGTTPLLCSSYNVLQLLENLALDYYGCEYVKNLMINDKYSFLRTTGMGQPAKIITRYNQHPIDEKLYPLEIVSNFNNSELSKSYYSTNGKETDNILKDIFAHNSDINEVLVRKKIVYDKEVVISIIGNRPFSMECTNVYVKGKSVNWETEKNNELLKLVDKSYYFFHTFSLRDYVQFRYIYSSTSKQFYLVDVNTDNILNTHIVSFYKTNYNLQIKDIIYVIILAYATRHQANHYIKKIIRKINSILPETILNQFVSLDYKIHSNIQYNYRDVCRELQKRFLKPEETNKYEVLSLLDETFSTLPNISNINTTILGDRNASYDFLKSYEEIPLRPQAQQEILKDSINIFNGQKRWHAPTTLQNVNTPVMFSTIVASAVTNMYNPNAMEKKKSAGMLDMEKQIIKNLSDLIGWNSIHSAGSFTTGGKACMTYAIKCGLNRCTAKESDKTEPIVITSDINHFSVEATCEQLGLSKKACIRIPTTTKGVIDFKIFETVLRKKINSKIPIACIIFSGGNTTHCNVEDIKKGNKITEKVAKDEKLSYMPFIYYDLVVGWPWLFYKNYDFNLNKLQIPISTLNKVRHIVNKVKSAYLSDAIGIDFHKLGFAPYTNSIFITKDHKDLYNLVSNNSKRKYLEPYQYTFFNSRTSTNIIAAWNVLHSVGIEGFQAYIANMISVTNIFEQELSSNNFDIIEKENTYGFAIIFWTKYPNSKDTFKTIKNINSIKTNNEYLYSFSEYLLKNDICQFSIRFLPNYKLVSDNIYLATLSILPMTLNLNVDNANIYAKQLIRLKIIFDRLYLSGSLPNYGNMPEHVSK